MITLKDISERAGVSTVTVSNVINGNLNKVSKETQEKIEKIIEELGYVPNASARSLARKESKIIGVVIPYIGDAAHFLKSPYNAEVIGVLEQTIRKQGYYLMIRCVNSLQEIIPTLMTWDVDGIIFLGAYQEEVEEIIQKIHAPMVFMDTYFKGLSITNVGADDYKGGYLATRYLLMNGHRQIAWVGPDIHSKGVIEERYKGYRNALKEFDIEVDEDLIFFATTTYDDGVEAGKKVAFAPKRPTAVLALSDITAIGVMEGLRLCGFSIPNDISIIGFDNLPECKYTTPQLTTVAQDITKKAQTAAEHLFKMIKEKKTISIDEKVEMEIVERQSVKSI